MEKTCPAPTDNAVLISYDIHVLFALRHYFQGRYPDLKKNLPIPLFFFFFSSAYIAHKDKDQTSQWPSAWRLNTPETRNQSQIIINQFQHETIDVPRFADRIVDPDRVNYKIEENSKKPANHFQSYHFHHTSAGANFYFF